MFYKPDRIFDRIKVMFTDALGQSFVQLKRMPVLAHTLIFFRFPAVQPYSLKLCACTECSCRCEKQRPADMTGKPQLSRTPDTPDGYILYFLGCAGSFEERGKKKRMTSDEFGRRNVECGRKESLRSTDFLKRIYTELRMKRSC